MTNFPITTSVAGYAATIKPAPSGRFWRLELPQLRLVFFGDNPKIVETKANQFLWGELC